MSGADPVAERRALTASDRLEEALFTGLRLVEGIDLDQFAARYGVNVWEKYGEALQPFVDAGWLVRDAERLRLTRAGMLMANEVMGVFV
jgi:oxygen-independent coproporphyrinogen-3 oxidase